MTDLNITINKASVYDQVAMLTSYVGAKADDANLYNKVFSTDADRELLERYWCETCNECTQQLRRLVKSVSDNYVQRGIDLDKDYELVLEMPDAYNHAFDSVVTSSLFSYFVEQLAAKWFEVADKDSAVIYLAKANNSINLAKSHLYYVKNIHRPMSPM